jgi:hypothetical protein
MPVDRLFNLWNWRIACGYLRKSESNRVLGVTIKSKRNVSNKWGKRKTEFGGKDMDRLKRRLSVFMMLATIFLGAGPTAWTQEIPEPVCYAIRAYVAEIDKALKGHSSREALTRGSPVLYARMQLDLAYNQYRRQIPHDYQATIIMSADELLRELSRGRKSREGLGIENWLLGLCPAQ